MNNQNDQQIYLSDESLQKLYLSQKSLCQRCELGLKNHFCIDEKCQKRQLVCWNCSKSFNNQHYLHKYVPLREFLKKKNINLFSKFISGYEAFKECISSLITKCEKLMKSLKQFEKNLAQSLFNLKKDYQESSVDNLIRKLNNFQNQQLNLHDLFTNYKYKTQNQLMNKIERINGEKITKIIRKIQKNIFTFDLNIEFYNLIWSCSQVDLFVQNYSILSMEDFQKHKLQVFDSHEISIKLGTLQNISFLKQIKNIKKLQIFSSQFTHPTLCKILEFLPNLSTLKLTLFFAKNPKLEEEYTLKHKNLESLEFNIAHNISQCYLSQFFNPFFFPSLYKILLSNSMYKNNITTLLSIFNQNYTNIRCFSIESLYNLNQKVTQEVLLFLQNTNFYFIQLHGLTFTEDQKRIYKLMMEENSALLHSSTNENICISREKSWFYSLAFYHKYKYLSKRTLKNIMLQILY